MINEISNIFKPSFVAVWIEMFLHALCGDWEQNPSKHGGKSTKLRVNGQSMLWTVGLSVTDSWPSGGTSSWLHMPWPLGVPKKDMQRFHDDFAEISAFLPVSKFEHCRFQDRCRWFYRCISSFICFISQIWLPCFSLFHHFVALKDVNVKSLSLSVR